MNEDDVLGQLRRLADVEPRVPVDRARVLRAGRRRLVARAVGATCAVTAVVLAGIPAVAALSADDPPVTPALPSATATPAPTLRAVVDVEAGTITLPMDQLATEPDDWSITQTAGAHFLATCMAEQGFGDLWTFDGPVTYEPQPSRNVPYGVWRESDVLANGYGQLAQSGDEGRAIDGDEEMALTECDTQLAAAGLVIGDDLRIGLIQEYDAPGGWALAVETDDEGRALREQWGQCLTDQGIAPPNEQYSMIPEGILEAPFEEQVRVGLIDVACKESLDFVPRMADLDAALQNRYLERTKEYRATVAQLDEAILVNARQYLADHAITVP